MVEDLVLFQVVVPRESTRVLPEVSQSDYGILKKSNRAKKVNTLSRRHTKKTVKYESVEQGNNNLAENLSNADSSGKPENNAEIKVHPAKILAKFLLNVGIFDYTVIPLDTRINYDYFTSEELEGDKQLDTLARHTEKEEASSVNKDESDVAETSPKLVESERKDGLKSTDKETIDRSDSQPLFNKNNGQMLFIFSVKIALAEEYLHRLVRLGIGNVHGFGSVNVVPVHLHRYATTLSGDINEEVLNATESNPSDPDRDLELTEEDKIIQKMRNKVLETIKSRVAVDSVIKIVNSGAEFSFDYLMLCLVASVIAAVGLVTNSVVVIVASMLISPIMGPILGITFGYTIRDFSMVRKGAVSEFAGLMMCLIIGLLTGLIAAHPTYTNAIRQSEWDPDVVWPPFEMTSRGTLEAIMAGVVVAFFSGIGVALSVLGNNATSLVGVAISASLLPPAVNTGVLLGYAALVNTFDTDAAEDADYIETDSLDLCREAGLSFALTIVNIILIIIAGGGMFHLKEVTPEKNKNEFWTTHLHNARNYNTIARDDKHVGSLLKNVQKALRNEHSHSHSGNTLTGSFRNPQGTFTSGSNGTIRNGKNMLGLAESFFVAPKNSELKKLKKDTDFVPRQSKEEIEFSRKNSFGNKHHRGSLLKVFRRPGSLSPHSKSKSSLNQVDEIDVLKEEMEKMCHSDKHSDEEGDRNEFSRRD